MYYGVLRDPVDLVLGRRRRNGTMSRPPTTTGSRAAARSAARVALQTRPVANKCEVAAFVARIPLIPFHPRLANFRGAWIDIH